MSTTANCTALQSGDNLAEYSNISGRLYCVVRIRWFLREACAETVVAESRVTGLGGSRNVGIILTGSSKIPVRAVEADTAMRDALACPASEPLGLTRAQEAV